ncbi:MAG: hypothetical protein GVY12_01245 [Bacteroidetes bacterium]|jgi:hypothetical protein|nr:hypothetical protein [Bacteroidota bacterium]
MDSSVGVLYTLSHDLELLNSFGRKGQGPGEFEAVGRIFLADSVLFVPEVGSNMVSVLSVDGDAEFVEYKSTPRLSGVPNSHITLVDDSLLYVGGRSFSERVNLMLSSDGLNTMEAVESRHLPSNPIWASNVATALPSHRLLIAYRYLPYLEVISGKGVIETRRLVYPEMDTAGADVDGYDGSQGMLEATRNRPEEFLVSDITSSDEGYVFVLLNEGAGTSVQIYDEALTYLASFELPEAAIGLKEVNGRYLFAISGDRTEVHKYRYELHELESEQL